MRARRQQADPVTPALWEALWRRDVAVAGGCVARYLGAPGGCRNVWGDPAYDSLGNPLRSAMQADHVHDGGGSVMGLRAPSDLAHLVLLCAYHHETWARSHRTEERQYLARFFPDVHRGYV